MSGVMLCQFDVGKGNWVNGTIVKELVNRLPSPDDNDHTSVSETATTHTDRESFPSHVLPELPARDCECRLHQGVGVSLLE